MKLLILSFTIAMSLFGSFAEANNQPVFYFQCEGYNKVTGKFWTIRGQEKTKCQSPANPDPADIGQACDYDVEIFEATQPNQITHRVTKGMQRQDSFVVWFWPSDIAEPAWNFEGMLTVENTRGFPRVTRFAAHAWLAQNPVVTNSAFNFVCEVF